MAADEVFESLIATVLEQERSRVAPDATQVAAYLELVKRAVELDPGVRSRVPELIKIARRAEQSSSDDVPWDAFAQMLEMQF